MAEIKGGTFEGGHVDVDGNYYRECIFRNTEIRYSGGPPPSFVSCEFDACTLGISGAATNTIAYLHAIYHGFGEWGSGSVEKMFEQIRQPAPLRNPAAEEDDA